MKPLDLETILGRLFEDWAEQKAEIILPLAPSGSKRIYYRIEGKDKVAIASYNENLAENQAFIYLSKHFEKKGLPVPKIYAEDLDQHIYLQEDLGFTTLYSFLLDRDGDNFPEHILKLYKSVVEELAILQIKGSEGLDYGNCYPSASFDKQSILWDLQSFKYYFLKFCNISFDEIALEKDFQGFADYLLEGDTDFFMFRDFQTRNIMIKDGKPFFIDYQGGRKGALQYDVASLLFQAKANIPSATRELLLEHYIDAVEKLIPIDRKQFIKKYYAYVLIRCLQVFGAYGFRGIYERKEHFLESIPFAVRNLKWLCETVNFEFKIPELSRVFEQIISSKEFEVYDTTKGKNSLLTVEIKSFSYKKGIPKDNSGHGGGFVFDCRFLHNPGRYEPYKELTGRDESVINFLQQHSKMPDFLNDIYRIADEAVSNYIERSFTKLSFNFGCTGGRHRSVYAADKLASYLSKKFGVKIILQHRERGWEKELLEN